MNNYLNTYGSTMNEDNYLIEVKNREAFTYFNYWMQGLRPMYYANTEYLAYIRKYR